MTTVWDEAYDAAASEEPDVELLGIDAAPDEGLPSEALVALINLGELSTEVKLYGHMFRIRTLRIGEELEIGQLISRYSETPEEGRAYACAIVAASIVSVDGRALVLEAIGPHEQTLGRKFDYVRSNFFWPVIEALYEEVVKLRLEQQQALEELRLK